MLVAIAWHGAEASGGCNDTDQVSASLIPGRWFDNSKGGSAGGPRLDKCRAFTEEELASQEVQEGGWFNQVAFEVMRVGCASCHHAC